MVQRFNERQDEPNTARFGRIPCSCQDLTCGCCAQFNVRIFDYNKRGLLKRLIFMIYYYYYYLSTHSITHLFNKSLTYSLTHLLNNLHT